MRLRFGWVGGTEGVSVTNGMVQRYFIGRVWSTTGGEVPIRGYQHADGTVTDRHIVVTVSAEPVSAAAVRERARAEVAAADELDRPS